jgi:glycosyltransferase involved in cell wall biosynthesis
MKRNLVFMWLNFGPSHEDRCEDISSNLKQKANVFGIEVYSKSDTYGWETKNNSIYTKITLFPGKTKVNEFIKFYRLLLACLKLIPAIFFFCNYESTAVLFVALILRILRQPVVVMNDSKFDDYSRNIKVELIKLIFYAPYKYAIGASKRSIDYLKFFCFEEKNIFGNYNSLSIERIQNYAAPRINFHSRDFIVVARLVPKKNIKTILDGYKIYRLTKQNTRQLTIIGDGPLLEELMTYAKIIGIQEYIAWAGFLQYQSVYKKLSESLCLILLSTEEQFGHVIIEAISLGIPCIVSTQVGSREEYIISSQTGFIVEENNPEGLSYFMEKLSSNEKLWSEMSEKCTIKSKKGDVSEFRGTIESILKILN